MTKKGIKDIYDKVKEANPSLKPNQLEYYVFWDCLEQNADDFVMHFAGNEAESVLRSFAWRMWRYSQMYKEIENGL